MPQGRLKTHGARMTNGSQGEQGTEQNATRPPGVRRAGLRSVFRTIIIAQCCGVPLPMVLLSGGVFSLFVLHLGGGKFEIGLVFCIQFIAQAIRVLAARHADARDSKKMFTRWSTAATLSFAAVFFVAMMRPAENARTAVWFVCGVFFVSRTAMNVGSAAWMPLLGVLVPAALRGRFFGAMRRAFMLVSLGLVLLAGLYLGDDPSMQRFFVIFAVLIALSLIRPILILRLPDPVAKPRTPEPLLRSLARPFRDAEFRRFLLLWAYIAWAANLGRPFLVAFLKQDLNFPSSVTVYTSSPLLLGIGLSVLPWGRLADRHGTRLVILLGVGGLSMGLVIFALCPHYASMPLLAGFIAAAALLVVGIALGGLGIGQSVRIMHMSPARYRASYVSTLFIAQGLIGAVTSGVAGFALDRLSAVVSIRGADIMLLRIYLPCTALLLLFAIPLLKITTPVKERDLGETVTLFIESLPSVVAFPLKMVRIVIDPKRTQSLRPGSEEPNDRTH